MCDSCTSNKLNSPETSYDGSDIVAQLTIRRKAGDTLDASYEAYAKTPKEVFAVVNTLAKFTQDIIADACKDVRVLSEQAY